MSISRFWLMTRSTRNRFLFLLLAISSVFLESDWLSWRRLASSQRTRRDSCSAPTACEISKQLYEEHRDCEMTLRVSDLNSATWHEGSLTRTLHRGRFLGLFARVWYRGVACLQSMKPFDYTWAVDGDVMYRGVGAGAFRVYSTRHRKITVQVKGHVFEYFIEYKKPPFTVLLSGGNLRPVPAGGQFIVNASLSFDPDASDYTYFDNVVFRWFCKVAGKNEMPIMNEEHRLYEELPRRVRRAIPDDIVIPSFCCTLEAVCSDMNNTAHTSFVHLTAESFPHKDRLDYLVHVELRAPGRDVGNGMQLLNFVPIDRQIRNPMRIACVYNCWGEMDPSDWIVFEARCELDHDRGRCHLARPVWAAVELPDKSFASCFATGARNVFLVFKRNCLPYGTKFGITMSVNYNGYTDEEHTVLSGRVVISTKPMYQTGLCMISPSSGHELITVFTVSCKGMATSSLKDSTLLLARFTQKVVNARDGKEHELLLHFGSINDSPVDVLLVAGNREDHVVTLKVELTENKMSPSDHYMEVMVEPLRHEDECAETYMFCMVEVARKYLDYTIYSWGLRRGLQVAQIVLHMLNNNPTTDSHFLLERQMIRLNIAKLSRYMERVYFESFVEQVASIVRLLFMGDPLEVTMDTRESAFEMLTKVLSRYEKDAVGGPDQETSARSFEVVARKLVLALERLFTISRMQSSVAFVEEVFNKGVSGDIHSVTDYVKRQCQGEWTRYRSYKDAVMQIAALMERFVFQDVDTMVLEADAMYLYLRRMTHQNSETRQVMMRKGPYTVEFRSSHDLDKDRWVYFRYLTLDSSLYPSECVPSVANVGMVQHFEAKDVKENRLITTEMGEVFYNFYPLTFEPGRYSSRDRMCYGMYVTPPSPLGEQRQVVHKFMLDSFPDGDEQYGSIKHLYLLLRPSPKTNKPFRLIASAEVPYKRYYNDLEHEKPGHEISGMQIFMDDSLPSIKQEMFVSVFLDENVARQFLTEKGEEVATFYYWLDFFQFSCLHFNESSNKWTRDTPHQTHATYSVIDYFMYCSYPGGVQSSHSVHWTPLRQTRVMPRDRERRLPFPHKIAATFAGIFLLPLLLLLLLAFIVDGCWGRDLLATVLRDVDPGSEFQHAYLVSVSTGAKPGTMSMVSFQLKTGQGCCSDIHLLKNVESNTLRRFRDEHFLVFTSQPLGQIDDVLLFMRRRTVAYVQDPHEEDDLTSWQLRDVRVYDVENDESWGCIADEELITPSSRLLSIATGEGDTKDYRATLREQVGIRFQQLYLSAACLFCPCCRPFIGEMPNSIRILLLLLFVFVAPFVNLALRRFPNTIGASYLQREVDDFVLMPDRRNILLALYTAIIMLPIVFGIVFAVRWLFVKRRPWTIDIDLGDCWKRDLELLRQETQRLEALRLEQQRRLEQRRHWQTGGKQRMGIVDTIVAGEPVEGHHWMNVKARQRLRFNVRTLALSALPPLDDVGAQDYEAELFDGLGGRPDIYDEDQGSEGDRERQARHSQSLAWQHRAFRRNRSVVISWLGLLLIWLPIAVFVFLFVYLGQRLSMNDVRAWLVSSYLGLLICLLVLYPLLILVFAAVVPIRRHRENRSKIRNFIPAALDERNQRILESGSVEEYREYIRLLRQQPIYGH